MSQLGFCQLCLLFPLQQEYMCAVGADNASIRQQGVIQHSVSQYGFLSVRINPQQYPVSGTDSRILVPSLLILSAVLLRFQHVFRKEHLLGRSVLCLFAAGGIAPQRLAAVPHREIVQQSPDGLYDPNREQHDILQQIVMLLPIVIGLSDAV